MFRVTAQAITTLMVYLFIAGDVTEIVSSHHNVSGTRLRVDANTPIASASSFARSGASPYVAWGYNTVNSITAVTDIYTIHNAIADLLTTIRMGMVLTGWHYLTPNNLAILALLRAVISPSSSSSNRINSMSCSEYIEVLPE
jgi:hypothetical protein